MRVLPPLPGNAAFQAGWINNRDQIVGASGGRAVLHMDGVTYDLNDLIPHPDPDNEAALTGAYSINDHGVITVGDADGATLLLIPASKSEP